MKYLLILSILSASFFHSPGQTIFINQKITWETVHGPTGMLLLGTKRALYGVKPKTNEPAWRLDLDEKWNYKRYGEIPFSPFITFEKKPFLSSQQLSKAFNTKGKSILMVDAVSGVEVFDSEKAGYRAVFDTRILPKLESVYFLGLKDSLYTISLVNYNTGQARWEKTFGEGIDFLNAFDEQLKTIGGARQDVFVDQGGNLFILAQKRLMKQNGQTGALIKTYDGVERVNYFPKRDLLILATSAFEAKNVGEKTSLTAIDNTLNQATWRQPVEMQGSYVGSVCENDELMCMTTRGFNRIDLSTGDLAWEKMPTLPFIKRIIPMEDGYVVIQNKWVARIDSSGWTIWPKKVEMAYNPKDHPIAVGLKEDQILYASPGFANMVDAQSGQKKWKKNLNFKDPNFFKRNINILERDFTVAFNSDLGHIMAYSNGAFFHLKPEAPTPPDTLTFFKTKGGAPTLTPTQDGFLVHRGGDYLRFDREGQLVYEKHYEIINNTLWLNYTADVVKPIFKVYSITTALFFTAFTNAAKWSIYSGYFGGVSDIGALIYQGGEDYNDYSSVGGFLTSKSFLSILKRNPKDRRTVSHAFVQEKTDDALRLLALNLENGKETLIEPNVKSRSFLIDDVDHIIYFPGKYSVDWRELELD